MLSSVVDCCRYGAVLFVLLSLMKDTFSSVIVRQTASVETADNHRPRLLPFGDHAGADGSVQNELVLKNVNSPM